MNASQKRLFEEARKRNPDLKMPSENKPPANWSEADLATGETGSRRQNQQTPVTPAAATRRCHGRSALRANSRGSVVTYFEAKGFGFLRPDDGGRDIFFHVSRLSEGLATDLRPGTRVLYELGMDRTGKMAASSLRIPPPDDSRARRKNKRYNRKTPLGTRHGYPCGVGLLSCSTTYQISCSGFSRTCAAKANSRPRTWRAPCAKFAWRCWKPTSTSRLSSSSSKTSKQKAVGEEVLNALSPSQQVVKIVHEELIKILGSHESKLRFANEPPSVFLIVGLQGSGKTTSTGNWRAGFPRTATGRWWSRWTSTGRRRASN